MYGHNLTVIFCHRTYIECLTSMIFFITSTRDGLITEHQNAIFLPSVEGREGTTNISLKAVISSERGRLMDESRTWRY